MAAIVGALRAVLSLESAAFQTGLKNAQKGLGNFQKKMNGIGSQMQRIGAGISVAGAGIALAIRGQLNAADDMGKAAQKFGVGVEELSRLKYAADLSDVSFEALGMSLGRLSKQMVASPQAFTDLGVAVLDAEGKMRGADQVMADLADVFARMPDGAEKTALAIKLFGKSGADLIPLLNGGTAALNDLAKEADELGITMDAKTAKSAEAFNDNLTRLNQAVGALVREIAEALAPTLLALSEKLIEVVKWFRELSPGIREAIAKIAGLTVVLGPALIGLGLAVTVIGNLARVFGVLAAAVLANPVIAAIAAIAAGGALVWYNWDRIAELFSETWQAISAGAAEAWAAIKATWDGVIQYFRDLLAKLPKVFEDAWVAVKANVKKWVEDFKQIGRDIMKGLSEGILGSRDMTGIAMEDAMGGLIGTAEDAVDSHSPSRVFKGIGQDIMAGLSIGLGDGAAQVNTTMAGIADTLGNSGLTGMLDDVKSSFESFFKSVVTGSKGPREALASMLDGFASKLMDSGLSALFDGLFGGLFANGAAFEGGRVTAFAKGGVVSGPTAFAMQSGLGMMGEAGPEAVMPLTRIGGKLGVMAGGGGGAPSVTFNVDARGASKGVDEMISDALSRATPRIVTMAMAGVQDARRRGQG